MSGLVAIFNPAGIKAACLADMIRASPTRASGRDVWEDPCFAAARLHHGVIEAAPQPTWDAGRTLCLFMDGGVPGFGDASAPAACLSLFRGRRDRFADLNGSFALIVYDAVRRRVSLVSDRMNTRPLYYFQAGRELVVATHVAALTAHPDCPRTLDRQSLHELIAYRQVLGANTIYDGIRWMEPGSIVTFDGATSRTRAYWRMRWREPDFPQRDLPDLIAEAVRAAVRRRRAPGIRHGVFLSGGLDSRIILAAAEEPLPCLTLGDVETGQLRCAREAAAIKGAPHHFLPVSPDDFWSCFEEGVRLTGGIYGCQHNHFLPVLDRTREHCDVAFSGGYLDTILRGSFMPARRIAFGGVSASVPWPASLPSGDLPSLLARSQKTASPVSLVRSVLSREAEAEHEDRLRWGMRNALVGFESDYPHHAWSYVMMRSMPHNLGFPNVLSIRSRMEVELVAWDHELLEIALRLPPGWVMPDNAYRSALALLSPALARLQYANDGMPADANVYLRTASRMLGASARAVETRLLGNRPLNGSASWLDFCGMLRQAGPLRRRLEDLPRSEALAACGIFDPVGLQAAVDGHLHRNRNHAKFLLMLLTVDEWIRQFGATGTPLQSTGAAPLYQAPVA